MADPKTARTVIFAGSADISDENMRALLANWLPDDLPMYPPVIPDKIPRRGSKYKGLRLVEAWLEEYFPEPDAFERAGDLTAYIAALDTTDNAYLVLLWGDGSDPDTEQLAAAAQARGITILDLTDGLEEIRLTDDTQDTPEPEPEPAARQPTTRRRRRAEEAAAPAETAPAEPVSAEVAAPAAVAGRPPWEDDTEPPVMQASRILAHMWGTAFAGLAEDLLKFSASGGADIQITVPEEPETSPPGTRTWLQNPANPGELVLRGRGKPRAALRSWHKVYLTADQEKALSLNAG